MATKYRVYKQLIPAAYDGNDPSWAKRQIWVAKLNSSDTVDEYDTQAEADTQKAALEAADPTARQYKVETVEV